MKRRTRVTLLFLFTILIASSALALPGMPWSNHLDHGLKRFRSKLKIKASALRGEHPAEALLSGKVMRNRDFPEPVRGTEVGVVESPSGYSSLTDGAGRFVIPHLTWCPGAEYHLLLTGDVFSVRRLIVMAPPVYPENGVMNIGQLFVDEAPEADGGQSPIRSIRYDRANDSYYRALFDRLAVGVVKDAGKIDRICRFVATRLNYSEMTWSFPAPKDIIERGSGYCSNLALAMAAITTAGNYPTRTVHLTDSPRYTFTHVTVEVYYDDAWHLYDPTYGIHYSDENGVAPSYRELRLNPALVRSQVFAALGDTQSQEVMKWMPADFTSGYNQIYQTVKDCACSAW
jgi:hypothetical protein